VDSVGFPLPGGERVRVRGLELIERSYPLSQSKSDVSDFDRLLIAELG
jgi:hypothetical protein